MSQLALDGGLLWMMSDKVTWGLSLLNVGKDKAFLQDKDAIPTTLRAGVKWNALDKTSFLCDLSEGRDKVLQKSLGAEITLVPFLSFRFGAAYKTELEYTGGLGLMLTSSHQPKSETAAEVKPDSSETHDTLQELDDLVKSESHRKTADVSFGLDYAARVNSTLGVTHTVSFKILY